MSESEDKGREARRHPRISWGFLVRHKPHEATDDCTELSTIKNISVGGCYFGSQKAYPPGQILDLTVKLPGVKDLLVFQGQVKRCHTGQTRGLCFLAVEFVNMNAAQKDEFSRAISFFIKKKNK